MLHTPPSWKNLPGLLGQAINGNQEAHPHPSVKQFRGNTDATDHWHQSFLPLTMCSLSQNPLWPVVHHVPLQLGSPDVVLSLACLLQSVGRIHYACPPWLHATSHWDHTNYHATASLDSMEQLDCYRRMKLGM